MTAFLRRLTPILVTLGLLGCRLVAPSDATPTASPAVSLPSPAAGATALAETPTARSTTLDPLPDMEAIQGQISTVRGLYPTAPLQRELLPPEELGRRIRDDFFGDYTVEEADDDARVLALLGLVEPGFDLRSLYIDFYQEQVAGYYDLETQTMLIVGSGWTGMERLTYAHEYVHALQDQTYGLEQGLGYTDEACEADSERCAAISALIEGDATLAEEQWWQAYATEQDVDDLMAALETLSFDVFERAPAYLQQDFSFPYEEGLEFVRYLFRRGGWSAVDKAYLDPPTTTEHILHPERYGKDDPIPVALPDLAAALGDGWRRIESGVLGEWFTRLVLDEEIPSWEAAEAAAGWGGDAYQALVHDADERGALVVLLRWDSARDAFEFVEAFHDYAGWRFGERRVEQGDRRWSWDRGGVLLERIHDQTLWILAPDEAAAAVLRAAVEFPVSP